MIVKKVRMRDLPINGETEVTVESTEHNKYLLIKVPSVDAIYQIRTPKALWPMRFKKGTRVIAHLEEYGYEIKYGRFEIVEFLGINKEDK